MPADRFFAAHNVDKIVRKILRMRCHESKSFDPLYIRESVKQSGKSNALIKTLAVGIDILPE